MPARWLAKAAVAALSASGPRKPVTRPDSANSPKYAARAPAGAMRAIRLRLAACAGPTKMPMAWPRIQNVSRSCVSSNASPSRVSPDSAIRMVVLAPIRSSTKANPSAPSPAVTFNPMPKISTSVGDRPNCPAA